MTKNKSIIEQWKQSGILDGLTTPTNKEKFKLFEAQDKCEIKKYDLPIARRFLNSLPKNFDFVYGWKDTYGIDEDRIMF